MSAEQNKQAVIRLFREGMNKRDFSVAEEIIGDSYVNHGFPGMPAGMEGFRQILNNFITAFPDMQIMQEEVVAEGETVAARGKWTGTNTGGFMGMPPTQKKVEVAFMDFWRFSDGKAVENWVQMDMPALMQQLGLK